MNEHLKTLTDIRSLMERSTRFLSLSGLSGVSAGTVALLGAVATYLRFPADWHLILDSQQPASYSTAQSLPAETTGFLVGTALMVLLGALVLGLFFTVRKAHQQGQRVWNQASRRLLWAMAVPLVAGGVFSLALLYYQLLFLTVPVTLIFYGLALLNGCKYTVRDVESLAYSELVLGLAALFLPGYNLLFWATGFGVLHVGYGAAMYWKYDRALPKADLHPTE